MINFFENLKNHFLYIEYIMIRHFNIQQKDVKSLELDFIYSMMRLFRREEKSKEFVQMALAGVDLKKSSEYQNFIREEIKPTEIDMDDMEEIETLSLKLLQGGASNG